MSQPPADPFDTAGLRAAVLESWRSSPTRYREDANVEEDYALGAYRDRLVIELAQNAADAARAAGVPGRMQIKVTDDGLVVSNTGAPLDLAGVRSMAAMRASAKGGDSVGRFGVGFAAVLSVTDAPAVASRAGSVRFSRSDSADLMRHDPVLAELLMDRQPPVLRLPMAYDRTDVGEHDTAVILPWRDAMSRERALDALRGIDDALFVALPNLVELVIDGALDGVPRHWRASRDDDLLTVSVDGRERHWWLCAAHGVWSESDLAEASVEARQRTSWSLTWAVPTKPDGSLAEWPRDDDVMPPRRVVHAPTPTDEPLALPALLVGDFPVDASRRRLAEGAMTDVVLDAAASAYVGLVEKVALRYGEPAVSLVPAPDLVGPVDDRLRSSIREQLGRTAWVRRAHDGSVASPSELVAVEPPDAELVGVLAPHVTDLLAPGWLPHRSVLRGLGLPVRSWPDVWDVVSGLEISGAGWHEIYAASNGLDRSALEGLPVLLGDGRVLRDARSCVLPPDDGATVDDDLSTLGLAVVDRDAAHPLLERLGARAFDPREHLGDDFVRRVNAVTQDDAAEARELLRAAASVLAASGLRAGELVRLGAALVPTDGGEWHPAAQVVLPGTPLADDADSSMWLDASLASAAHDGWLALGVLGALTVVDAGESPLGPDVWDDLMLDGGGWCDAVGEELGVAPGELVATSVRLVRGLELVEGMSADRALALLGAPDVRGAIVEPALVLSADGRTRPVTSPAAWWLSEAPLFDGRAPVAVRLPGDERLATFFPEVSLSSAPDTALLEAVGVHTTADAWVANGPGTSELLSAMADPGLDLSDHVLPLLYAALRGSSVVPDEVDAPNRIRAMVAGHWRLVDPDDVVVAQAPHHALVLSTPCVPGDSWLAELLDVGVSTDSVCGATAVPGSGALRDVPEGLGEAIPKHYREHDELVIGDTEVDWWVTDDGEVHACTVDGLARALAWAAGQWSRRWELSARLSGGVDREREALEALYEG